MSSRRNTVAKGNLLEDEVADLYRQLDGVRDVKQKVIVDGVEIDVLVTIETADGTLSRYAIDAKNYESTVKAERARKCINDFKLLRDHRQIDHGIIVAKEGFTRGAWSAAEASGVRVFTIKDLRRKVSGFSPYLSKWIETFEQSDLRPQVYIPLRAKTDDDRAVGIVEQYILHWFAQPDPGTLITLLGNYGTGKSTSLHQIMAEQAHRYLHNPANERIPIFVDLKRFRQAPAAEALMTNVLVNQVGVSMNFAKFMDLNSQGRFVLFLDGFDEMAEKVIEGMPRDHFRELAQLAVGNAKVIITCRTHYFRDHQEVLKAHGRGDTDLFEEAKSRDDFQILFLELFSREEIETYLKNRVPEEWQAYKQVIDGTYDLASLAEVPILLNMIVTALPTLQKQGGPINRPAIYRHFTEKWLYRDEWRKTLRVDERRYFCQQLALHFYKTQEGSVHWRELPKFLKEHLKNRQIETLDDVDIFSSDVRTSNFLVRDDAGRYSFVHKSFMEFFVAELFLEAIRHSVRNGLDDLKSPNRSRVVWEFLSEMLQPDDLELLRKDLYRVERVRVAELSRKGESHSGKLFTNPSSLGNAAGLLLSKGMSLPGANLEGARLDGMSIAGTSLSKSMLNAASFRDARLTNVDLKGSTVSHATFDGAVLSHVDFSRANLDRVDFRNAELDTFTVDSIAEGKYWGSAWMKPVYKSRIQRLYRQSRTVSEPTPSPTGDGKGASKAE